MKIAAFSDCHWLYEDIKKFPKADICIFAGDWSGDGVFIYETVRFVNWFSKLPYLYKIVIPGNHDFYCQYNINICKQLFEANGINLLIDEEIEVNGLKIYGTPWSPFFNNWAFMLNEEELKNKFRHIPSNLDILITHTPPKGILDNNLGSNALLERVNEIKPKINIFGHIHEGYGKFENKDTKFYNVSVVNDKYKLVNKITIINMENKNSKKQEI